MDIHESIVTKNKNLSSFVRGKCVAEAAIEAIMKLIEPSGKTFSLHGAFEQVAMEANSKVVLRSFSNRRFAKKGHDAAGILYHRHHILEAIRRNNTNNMLVQAVNIYLHNNYVLAAIEAIALFSFNVTLPFLNFTEKGTQSECLTVLPGEF